MTAVSTEAPLCFMHVPKCGGTSVRHALERALSAEALGQMRLDRSAFCGGFEDFVQLSESVRAQIAADDAELTSMATARVVAGHFSLASLSRLAPSSSVAIVLREPRARLVSLYTFWRLHTLEMRERWHPYRAIDAAQRPFDEFLADSDVAPVTDNPVCRMLLYGEGLIPTDDLIPASDASAVAAAAVERLETLGLVAVLETGERMWRELSRFFGVSLEPAVSNITGVSVSLAGEPFRVPITPFTLELLELRTGADARLYEHVLARDGWDTHGIERLRQAAFAEQLVRLGDVSGRSAAEAARLRRELDVRERAAAELEIRLAEREAKLEATASYCNELRTDLERHRVWLDAVQNSASWRLTAPLRRAKRAVGRSSRSAR